MELLSFDKLTFRCSSLGKIMGKLKKTSGKIEYDSIVLKIGELALKDPSDSKIAELSSELVLLYPLKDDNSLLPKTCISYLLELYVEKQYGVKQDIYSKYMEKGKAVEDVSIDLLGELDDKPYTKCILPRKYNEFIEGECDVLYFKKVIDMKNSWNIFTFYKRKLEDINVSYELQGIGYTELYDADEFELVYSLMNMPQHMIDKECISIMYEMGGKGVEGTQEYNDACAEFKKQVTFDNIELKERFYKLPIIKRNKARYNEICERIKLCRDWLNSFAKKEFFAIHGYLPEESKDVTVDVGFVDLVELKAPIVDVLSENNIVVDLVEDKGTGTGFSDIINSCKSPDEVRELRTKWKSDGTLTNNPELQDLLVSKRDSFSVTAPVPNPVPNKPKEKKVEPVVLKVEEPKPEIKDENSELKQQILEDVSKLTKLEEFQGYLNKHKEMLSNDKPFLQKLMNIAVNLNNKK